ncbi:unnamed protein product [Dovyalis caffra]|uniref:DnaJ homologue subfamily C member 28 conserved domain-containing protein n=1 Tax=Dovyalis caffra TaxID=77055 RepID=A0AAV1S2Z9_9ROSI|nr:unnamed protein product [Dovyalis caffra]
MAVAVRVARNGRALLSSSLINKSNNNRSAILLGAHAFSSSSASSSSISKPHDNKEKRTREEQRLSAVLDAVNDRKLPPELRGQRNSVRSETDIINVVEQRIWHSMEEGQFENLPGKGKPLNLNTNPHTDPAEDTLYRILTKNGCAPEWVELNKEIRCQISEWRLALKKAWMNKCNGDHSKWIEGSEFLQVQLRDINNKVSFWLAVSLSTFMWPLVQLGLLNLDARLVCLPFVEA